VTPVRRIALLSAVLVLLSPGSVLSGVHSAPSGSPGADAVHLPVDGEVVRTFSPPATPYGPGHRGVDLTAGPGEEVRAALAGAVAFAGPVAGVGWVTIDHGGGLHTTYGPLDPRTVGTGERVRAGQVVGMLAGDATHLDWGARLDGEYVDPLGLLGRWEAHLVPVGVAR
jgi:murein DD-endopeptidase MepM/ murein hydrolase activator NlpD